MDALAQYPHTGRLASLVATRRAYHAWPELSWTEFRTTARLCEELEQLGFSIVWGKALYEDTPRPGLPGAEALASAFARSRAALGPDNRYLPAMEGGFTGLVATMDGARPGPTRGFRFDIDALPIVESDASDHLPAVEGFRSQNEGVMHACGHDGHLTIGLGFARRLAASRATLRGRVHLFFQPAEEVAGGGVAFSRLPQLAQVESFVAMHLGIVAQRKLICDASWLAARIGDVRFSGRSSHAGNAPQDGRNALLAACCATQSLFGIARHSAGESRVNVGRFVSDNANNVISDAATFRFEVRGANDEVCAFMHERAAEVIQGAATMHGVQAEVRDVAQFIGAENSRALVDAVAEAARRIGMPAGDAVSVSNYLVPASEDATCMARTVQQGGGAATYLLLCSPTRGGHHNERFDFDEDLLGWGVDLCAQLTGIEGG